MGSVSSMLKLPSCDYCSARLSKNRSICYVYSYGKLDRHFVCDICLLNKSRRTNNIIL